MFCVVIEVFFDKYNKIIHILAPHEVLHNPWNRITVFNTLVFFLNILTNGTTSQSSHCTMFVFEVMWVQTLQAQSFLNVCTAGPVLPQCLHCRPSPSSMTPLQAQSFLNVSTAGPVLPQCLHCRPSPSSMSPLNFVITQQLVARSRLLMHITFFFRAAHEYFVK